MKQDRQVHHLSPEWKRFLVEKNQEMNPKPTPSTATSGYASYGPASTATLIARLVPQITGDGGLLGLRRFSLWGADSAVSPIATPETTHGRPSGKFSVGTGESSNGQAQIPKVSDMAETNSKPLRPQSTGGLRSDRQPKWYIDGLRTKFDFALVEHLRFLRAPLSSAPLPWIHEFMERRGLDILSTLLSNLVAKGGKRWNSAKDSGDEMLFEVIWCFRSLLNTDVFNQVLSSPTTITHIAYSLHCSSPKLRTVTSETLAGVCALSKDGYRAVVGAMSDYRVAYDEAFRFETVIGYLRLRDTISSEEEGARAASMALINTITECTEPVEERTLLREEFGRRGLNEVIVVCLPLFSQYALTDGMMRRLSDTSSHQTTY